MRKMLNKKGPNKEPCGTPLIMFLKELRDEFIFSFIFNYYF